MQLRRILLTGAAGRIGAVVRPALAARYEHVRMLDRLPISGLAANEEAVLGDLTDRDTLAAAVRDADAVVHLAGYPRIGDWDDILPANVIGTYELLEASRRAGVRRFVLASSHHAVGYYPRSETIGTDVPLRPDCGYGLSKAFGESAARMFADKYGMSAVCLRIGTCVERPYDRRTLMTWISPADMQRLAIAALEADTDFAIVYGISANTRARWDNGEAAALGYAPQDDSETFAPEILAQPDQEDPVAAGFHGGAFAAAELVRTPRRSG